MKIRNLIVLFLLVVIQNIVCMHTLVRQALDFESSGELERQIRDAKFEILANDIGKHHRKVKRRYLTYKAINTIEKGLYAKEEWQSGEIESLFSTLFSAKFPKETVEENIERFRLLD
jgi:ribonucleotide reductase alpha subunit